MGQIDFRLILCVRVFPERHRPTISCVGLHRYLHAMNDEAKLLFQVDVEDGEWTSVTCGNGCAAATAEATSGALTARAPVNESAAAAAPRSPVARGDDLEATEPSYMMVLEPSAPRAEAQKESARQQQPSCTADRSTYDSDRSSNSDGSEKPVEESPSRPVPLQQPVTPQESGAPRRQPSADPDPDPVVGAANPVAVAVDPVAPAAEDPSHPAAAAAVDLQPPPQIRRDTSWTFSKLARRGLCFYTLWFVFQAATCKCLLRRPGWTLEGFGVQDIARLHASLAVAVSQAFITTPPLPEVRF